MGRYAYYAASDLFEVAQEVQTPGYLAAVYVASSWMHKIRIDERWK